MSDRLGQLDRQAAATNKRIADLEAQYLTLLEELKMLRAELAKRPAMLTPPLDHQHGDRGPVYTAQFDRWPGASR